jgi:hypothetical protein
MIPFLSSSSDLVRSECNAPRNLNEPDFWRFSHLKNSSEFLFKLPAPLKTAASGFRIDDWALNKSLDRTTGVRIIPEEIFEYALYIIP